MLDQSTHKKRQTVVPDAGQSLARCAQFGSAKENSADREQFLLRRCEQLARWLDSAFTVPGTQIRIGWDALMGMIPGLGDLLGFIMGFYIVYAGLVLRIPRRLTALMALNLVLDWAIGLVPVGGDVFDFAWKANERNVRILRRALGKSCDSLTTEPPSRLDGRLASSLSVLLVSGVWCYFYLRPPAPDPVEPWFPRQDLAMHFTGMMVHACVCAWTASSWNRSLQTAWILSLMFGFVLEILQGVLDWGRTFDVTDMAANGFGVAAAFLLARAIEHRRAIQQ